MTHSPDPTARQNLMSVCAMATRDELDAVVAQLAELLPASDLRRPETGLVMLRGRMGGDGPAFNLGEATVSRAAVRLKTGESGFGYLLGSDRERARLAAIIDAAGQRSEQADLIRTIFIEPVSARIAEERRGKARRTAATRVNFFTMVRGED